MLKVFYLSSCSTCKRILSEVNLPQHELIDVKENPIDEDALSTMYKFTNSYEALVNKRAQLYKQRDLKSKQLTEANYKQLLLEHYTFLKRPVFLFDQEIFVGNAKKTIAQLKGFLND